jgi:glycosyltransferase involved in cell wall biosynthesis
MVIVDASLLPGSDSSALWGQPAIPLVAPTGEPRHPDVSPARRWPPGFQLSIVMPVYNERATIDEIISRVLRLDVPKELIIVDDGSSDGTREQLAAWSELSDVRVILHPGNLGKGAALRTGLAQAQGEVIAIQDADLEYDPGELLALVEPILAGEADAVFGSRFLNGHPPGQLHRHRWANALLTGLSNWLTGLSLTDMETGHKLFRREAIRGLEIEQDRFGIEPELTAKLARRGCRVIERPISYVARDYSQGKKIRFRDALDAVWCILRYGRG